MFRLVFVLSLAVIALSGCGAPRLSDSEVDAQYATLTPYQFLKVKREVVPRFEQQMRDSEVAAIVANLPQGKVKTDGVKVAFTDLGGVMKMSVSYSAEIPTNGEAVLFESEVHHYYRAQGLDVLRSTCAPAAQNCSAMPQLMQATEKALLGQEGATLDGILPADGECTTGANQDGPSLSCAYGDQKGALMVLERTTLARARQAFTAEATAEAKREVVERFRANSAK